MSKSMKPAGKIAVQPYVWIWVKTLLVVFLFVSGYFQFEQYFQKILIRNARAEVSQQLDATVKRTYSLLERRLTGLTAMRAYIDLHGEDEDFGDRFMVFAAKLYQEMEGIRNFAVAPGGVNRFVYPLDGNELFIGHNLLRDARPEVQSDIHRCMSTDATVMSFPYLLKQGGTGVAARQGIFREGRFWGLVTMILDWDYILATIEFPDNFHFGIRSNTGKVFYGDPDVFHNHGVLQLIRFQGSYWEFGVIPVGGWERMIAVELMTARTVAVFLLFLLTWGTFVIMRNQTDLTEQARLINRIIQLLGEDRPSYRQHVILPAYKVMLIYMIIGCLWIIFSDRLLMSSGHGFGLEMYTRFQTYKGWVYVIANAFLIYLVIQHYLKMVYLSSKGRLQTSGLLYQSLTSNFPNGAVCLFDREMNVVSIEGTCLNCLEPNLSRQEIKPLYEHFPRSIQSEIRQLCRSAMEGKAELAEIQCYHEIYQFNFFPVHNFAREIVAGLAVIQNITGLRQTEASLAASEERLRYALEGTNDALWDWNLETGSIFFSPRYLSILGYERQEHHATFDSWLETVHPEERERVRRVFEEARQSGLPYRIECRVMTKDQDWCWMLNRGQVIEGTDHRPSRIIGTLSDISEQKRANEQIRNLSSQIIHSQEEERRRISRELHDEAGQALTALRIYLDIIKKGLPEDNERLQQQLEEAIALSGQTMEQIRSLAQGLRPAALETLGLNSALKDYCTEFAKKTNLPIEYEGERLESVPYEVGITLYRFLQEGLTNVVKHAHADRTWVRLGYDGQQISLSIVDNGSGMAEKTASRPSGIGLIGIEERLHCLHGELQLTSMPGEGVRLTAIIPWEGGHDSNHDC